MRKGSILLYLISFFTFAQQEPFISNFRYQMSLFNPAYAGAEGNNSIALTTRNRWVAIENSPKTQVMTFSSERANNIGLGLSFISNNFFVERNTASYVDVSYRLQVTESSALFLGIKAGATFYKSNLLGLTSLGNELDPAQTSTSRVNPNMGVGSFFQTPSFWFSFSIPRLFNTTDNYEFSESSTDRVHTYVGTGLTFNVNENLFFKPSVLIRSVSNLNTTADFVALLSFKNYLNLGTSYRTTNTLGFLASISIIDFADIGYSYETPMDSGLSTLKINTHEIVLRFNFGQKSSAMSQSSEVEE